MNKMSCFFNSNLYTAFLSSDLQLPIFMRSFRQATNPSVPSKPLLGVFTAQYRPIYTSVHCIAHVTLLTNWYCRKVLRGYVQGWILLWTNIHDKVRSLPGERERFI